MGLRYRALLIGNSTFPADSRNLQSLKGPVNDVPRLRDALTHAQVGLFDATDVSVLVDEPATAIRLGMERFFTKATKDDQLLLYYSGHGVLTFDNHLYLCALDTHTEFPQSTAIGADFVNRLIEGSAARATMILLDCCYSGAFKGAGMPDLLGEEPVTLDDLPDRLSGSGRFVLTSCRRTELANDSAGPKHTSPFTQYVIDAMLGAAPGPDERFVNIGDVYDCVYRRSEAETRQTPQRRFSGEGDVRIARRSSPPPPPPPPPPPRPEWTWTVLASLIGGALAVVALLVLLLRCGAGDTLAAPEGMSLDGTGGAFLVDSSRRTVFSVVPGLGQITPLFKPGVTAGSATGGARVIADFRDLHAVVFDPSDGRVAFAADGRLYRGSSDGKLLSYVPLRISGLDHPIVRGLAADARGVLMAVGTDLASCVYRVGRDGTLELVAGTGEVGFGGDGGPAASAQISASGIAIDRDGNLLVADSGNRRLRQVLPDGTIQTIAGNGTSVGDGVEGDDGQAESATFIGPTGVTVGGDGDIYVADGNTVRVISPDGVIRRLAGTSTPGFAGDKQQATAAELRNVVAAAVDDHGVVYATDTGNGRLRQIDTDGVIRTVVA